MLRKLNLSLDITLDAEWHCYRFEYAVIRAEKHFHGLAKLKNDSGVYNQALKAVSAKQLLEKGSASPQSNLSELDSTVISESVPAE